MLDIKEFKKNFKIHSYFAPIVFSSVNGKKYAVAIGSPWIEIPNEMTSQDVHAAWVKIEKAKEVEVPAKITKKIISRKKEFIVTFTNKWNCTCSTFKTKRKCTHIDQVKKEGKS